ncbi:hypothetical protein B484DRAFT_451006 [Ochromonadaceae sp. CCMP2298]|nr:hypothetical protein B484DRAFT_451006 [Ochromonadaceae sp. CCMP2298]
MDQEQTIFASRGMEEWETQQFNLFAKVLELRNDRCLVPSSLDSYLPQSQEEWETQQFNVIGTVPGRLVTDEDVAMWILQSECLDRSRVCQYFTSKRYDATLRKNVLKKLAVKICSLDAAMGFVEGMKFFVPVVGCWDPDPPTEGAAEPSLVRYVLGEYVVAHLACSERPLFSPALVEAENMATLVELALCVLDLCAVLHAGRRPPSAAMADFFAALRNVLRGQSAEEEREEEGSPAPAQAQGRSRALGMSMKLMTDLYTAATSGLPLQPLKLPDPARSCLFARVHHSGLLRLNQSAGQGQAQGQEQGQAQAQEFGSPTEGSWVPVFARLTDDALYFFRPEGGSGGGGEGEGVGGEGEGARGWPVFACVPLESARVRTRDAGTGTGVGDFQLCGIADWSLPLINLGQWGAAPSIAYQPSVQLRVGGVVGGEEACETWVDAIESSCWECRSRKAC